MKTLKSIILSLPFIVCLGCQHDEVKQVEVVKPCDDHSICSSMIHKESSINYETKIVESTSLKQSWTDFEIKEGNKNVFEYKSSPMPGVADGSDISFVFEVDPDSDGFLYKDEELKEIKAIYRNICGECMGSFSKIMDRGIIKGTKVNDKSWFIEALVHIKERSANGSIYEYDVELSETFLVK